MGQKVTYGVFTRFIADSRPELVESTDEEDTPKSCYLN